MQSTTLRLVSLDVQMDWGGLLTILDYAKQKPRHEL